MKRHSSSTPSPPSLAPCGAFVAVLACAACAGAPAAERSAPAFSEAEGSALPVPHPTLRPGAVRLSAAEMELLGTPERPATPAVSARLGLTELVSSGLLRRSDVQLVEPPLALVAASTRVVAAQTPPCAFRGAPSALAERVAPLDSVLVRLGGAEAKLCYGRPAAGDVPRVGAEIPYGSPWQMGANEPTTLHLPFPATLGRVDLPAGSYSLYAIPEAEAWTIVVNGNPNRWGVPIGPDVRAADIGSFRAPTHRLPQVVDRLTFRFEGSDASSGALVFEWERTGLSIPFSRR